MDDVPSKVMTNIFGINFYYSVSVFTGDCSNVTSASWFLSIRTSYVLSVLKLAGGGPARLLYRLHVVMSAVHLGFLNRNILGLIDHGRVCVHVNSLVGPRNLTWSSFWYCSRASTTSSSCSWRSSTVRRHVCVLHRERTGHRPFKRNTDAPFTKHPSYT